MLYSTQTYLIYIQFNSKHSSRSHQAANNDGDDDVAEKVRWEAADLDDDGTLNREEFEAFLHPEDHDHMFEVSQLLFEMELKS